MWRAPLYRDAVWMYSQRMERYRGRGALRNPAPRYLTDRPDQIDDSRY